MQLLLHTNQTYAQSKTVIIIDKILACLCLLLLCPYIVTIYLVKRCVSATVIEQITIYGPHQSVITLYQFTGERYQCRELLALWHVITGKLCFIGEQFTFTCFARPLMLSKPGLVSINQLKAQNGLTFESTSRILNRCYHHPLYYLFNLFSCLLSHLFSNNKLLSRRPYFKLFGLTIRNTNMSQMLNELILDSLSNKPTQLYAFVNTDCMNKIYGDEHYLNTLQQFKHIFADGLGMRLACNKLGIQLQDNINGTDMFPRLCQLAAKRDAKIFLLGAKPEVARHCATNMQAQYPELQIVGCQHGYFEKHQTTQVIDKINASGANILLVAMGAPQQELWLAKHQRQLSVSCAIGVGGLFDFYANNVSRAPLWLRQIGMEWTWRLAQEPMRMWRRYILGNPLFLWRILKLKHTEKNKPRSYQYSPRHNQWHAHYIKFESVLQQYIKRLLDIILASSLIVIFSPLLCIIGLLIKLESSGPIVFTQQRVGQHNHRFTMFKLRSMQHDASRQQDTLNKTNEMKGGVLFKIKQDPRMTCIGYLIRKTSIDELPQLWNVIKGDMSLVGPRPALPSEVNQYDLHQRQRLNALPGITCFWQVNGRSNLTFEQQVELDLHYIQQQSLTTDIYLLAKTIPAVLTARGAY
ncbi:WecB/TagA/CpsF family glycosyltransferase [Shewanella marina]|uniref:WecB/TagA/CpsF family glycosyltransferase n=1 Tax=Shewanella marina TaxID=487319 RepID=UPI00046E83FD|nr:WecB/TagA/CpsF family glycosyltransferase [Shewanella marina]